MGGNTLPMNNAGYINAILQRPTSSHVLARILPYEDPRDDQAWQAVTQARRFPDGRFEVKTTQSPQEWQMCYDLYREDAKEVGDDPSRQKGSELWS